MSVRRPWFALALLVLLASPAARSWASPADSKVGDVRVTYSTQGTVLHVDASAISNALGTLASRTPVNVLEVKLPWIRVRAVIAGQTAPTEGWLRAWETVEPEALAQSAPPAHLTGASSGPVDSRDAAAASRQFDASTEGRYKASNADLMRAYPLVDRMEADTQALDPAEVYGFCMEGSIGQKGRDFARPARLPPERAGGNPDRGGVDTDTAGNVLGKLFGSKVGKAVKTLGKAGKFMKSLKTEFTPSQEYYLGRAVAASAIARYGVDTNESRRRYVKLVGDAVVRVTDRLPVNYGGYHFEVLNSDEVNGICGPGGFILVTRGAVEACKTEDELAGILGHELAHAKFGHGTEAVKKSKAYQNAVDRGVDLLGDVTDLGDSRVGDMLLSAFQEAAKTAAQTAMDHNYGSAAETQADEEGTYLLVDVVYDWAALRDLLRRMGQDPRLQGDASHFPPEMRARALDPVVGQYAAFTPRPGVREARLQRFNRVAGRATTLPPK